MTSVKLPWNECHEPGWNVSFGSNAVVTFIIIKLHHNHAGEELLQLAVLQQVYVRSINRNVNTMFFELLTRLDFDSMSCYQ